MTVFPMELRIDDPLKDLKEKQKLFIEEYMIDLNAKQAALRAGYSESCAPQRGFHNLRNPIIKAEIARRKQKASDLLEIKHEDVLNELKNWALSDITETLDLSPEEIKKLPLNVRRLITSYKKKTSRKDGRTTTTVELHFVSKEKAIDMINKHIGFYEVDNKQKASQIDVTKLSDKAIQEMLNASK